MTRVRIPLTALIEQRVPHPAIERPSLADRGTRRIEVVEISSEFPAGSAEDLAVWL